MFLEKYTINNQYFISTESLKKIYLKNIHTNNCTYQNFYFIKNLSELYLLIDEFEMSENDISFIISDEDSLKE